MISNRFTKNILKLKHVGLDSMCFIYQFDDHPQYAPLTNAIISMLENNRITAVTSVITIVEIFVHEEKVKDELTIHVYEQSLRSLPNLDITPIEWNTARFASKLRAKYTFLKTPDALQIATAILSGCNGFITNDNKLTKVKELKVISLDDYI